MPRIYQKILNLKTSYKLSAELQISDIVSDYNTLYFTFL